MGNYQTKPSKEEEKLINNYYINDNEVDLINYNIAFYKQIYEFNYLPGHIILRIFSIVQNNIQELPSQEFFNLSIVCKLWRYYAFHSVIKIKMVPERLESLLIPYKTSVLDNAFLSIQCMINNGSKLRIIDFSNIEIDKPRAMLISKSFVESKSIRALNFEYCYLDSEAVIELCKGLEKNESVKDLDFNNNKIGPEGAIAIANMLKVNKSIETINLSHNEIGNQGAIVIGEILKSTKRKVKMNLSSNHIGDEGVLAIVKARQQNNNGAKTSYVYKSGLTFKTINGKSTVVCP
ncbi:hypothetical protein DICPUDRAFT_75301 [Dictyostelium purpureum]|uniref:Uncharacterized protein n=1 Tax=Dictyostelium purpureum TaxID=5786 RepID=F0ZA97_DICPU|nr:uncharacterized protein DICPUDRAFT_75301 [Dictyostelium purpureum]EGC39110.1 hypothetical protein DICPUDRAFT_75301 [Dictyostelium purpureum]|eukprot:XP_003284362.1 hypothetical protein DICPUDRAFT_75301 [Dictyostelium purpureum]